MHRTITTKSNVSGATGHPSPAPAPAVDTVVEVDQVAGLRAIPIACRYTSTRPLEQDYELESRIVGTGMNGPVRLATGRGDGRKHAVKSFRKTGLSARKRAELKSEAEIYLSLDHPHVARLEMVYETDKDLHLVMEYMCGGELYDRLAKQKQYSEEAAAEATHQMLLAVAYLHAQHIAHRDLKLENFLYESPNSNHLKIIDFGFAKFWDHNATMSQACGSIHYVAPEVLKHNYTEKADMWSLGVIAWMLLTGSPPFNGSEDVVLQKIRKCQIHYSSRFERLSSPAKSFLLSLLVLDPNQRLSAQAALEHPWIKTRNQTQETPIDMGILTSLRTYAHTSQFRRKLLSMMAWSLSTEDRAELREQFLLLDKEKKGTIKPKDLQAIMMEYLNIDEDEAKQLFESMDTDQNEEIEYSEFLAAALVGHVKVHEDVLITTFQRFDIDGNGKIDYDELQSILGESFSDADIKELIREADTSEDGMIDYDEFLAYFYRSEDDDTGRPGLRRKHTEQLGNVIDKLVRSGTSDLVEHQRRPSRWQGLRSKTAPANALPTLLRAMAPTRKMKATVSDAAAPQRHWATGS